jgi:Zn-dependent M28 family amino/carboxypeptidase
MIDIENKVEERTLANVVGMLPGKDRADEIVLFSAHYDHLGSLPEKDGDSIANGADDDASGVAGIISLARFFTHAEQHRRTLVFAAFTAEEIGGYGSQYLAGTMDSDRIVAGVNLEMIGKVSDFGPGNGYMTGFEHSNLGEIMQRNLEGTGHALHPDPHRQNLFFRSDNINFAKLGVPAHSFSTGPIDRDPYYHTVDDELSTLDMAHMTRFLRGLAQALGTIVSGEDTPSRISL